MIRNYLIPLVILSMACACGDDGDADEPTIDAAATAGDAGEEDSGGAESYPGLPNAAAVVLPGAAQWIAVADDGELWVTTDNALLVRSRGVVAEAVALLEEIADGVQIIVPPPVVLKNGDVVVASARMDSVLCEDKGHIRWFKRSGGHEERELIEAPAFPFAVTSKGLFIGTVIEYK